MHLFCSYILWFIEIKVWLDKTFTAYKDDHLNCFQGYGPGPVPSSHHLKRDRPEAHGGWHPSAH